MYQILIKIRRIQSFNLCLQKNYSTVTLSRLIFGIMYNVFFFKQRYAAKGTELAEAEISQVCIQYTFLNVIIIYSFAINIKK